MAHEDKEGIDRRGALECMIWAGTGVLWTMVAGVPRSSLLGVSQAHARAARGFTFLQMVAHLPIVLFLLWLLAGTLTYLPPVIPQ